MSKTVLIVGRGLPASAVTRLAVIAAERSIDIIEIEQAPEREKLKKVALSGVNVGAIGNVDHGRSTLSAAVDAVMGSIFPRPNRGKSNKSDRKRNRADRWK